jgi:hypothetical protein
MQNPALWPGFVFKLTGTYFFSVPLVLEPAFLSLQQAPPFLSLQQEPFLEVQVLAGFLPVESAPGVPA